MCCLFTALNKESERKNEVQQNEAHVCHCRHRNHEHDGSGRMWRSSALMALNSLQVVSPPAELEPPPHAARPIVLMIAMPAIADMRFILLDFIFSLRFLVQRREQTTHATRINNCNYKSIKCKSMKRSPAVHH